MINVLILGGYALVLSFVGFMMTHYAKKDNEGWAIFYGVIAISIILFSLIFGFVKTYEKETNISDECVLYDIKDGVSVEHEGLFLKDKSVSARKYKYDNPIVIFYDKYSLFSNSKTYEDYIKISKKQKKKKKKKVKKEIKKELDKNAEKQSSKKRNITTI